VLELTGKVSIVSDEGQGQLLLEGRDEVGPCFFYWPYHILVMQVKGSWMAQDVPHILKAWVTCFVVTDCDGLAQVVDCSHSVAPLPLFDHHSDAVRLADIKLHL
jgi:hypothetical protein